MRIGEISIVSFSAYAQIQMLVLSLHRSVDSQTSLKKKQVLRLSRSLLSLPFPATSNRLALWNRFLARVMCDSLRCVQSSDILHCLLDGISLHKPSPTSPTLISCATLIKCTGLTIQALFGLYFEDADVQRLGKSSEFCSCTLIMLHYRLILLCS